MILMYKKGWMDNLGNYKSVSLTSVLGKEQIILSGTCRTTRGLGLGHMDS